MAIAIRRATSADNLAVARVHVRSWQVGYRGLLPDESLAGLSIDQRAARYRFDAPDGDGGPRTFVALPEGRDVDGFVTVSGDCLAALYVDPDAWRTGLGSALIARARDELAAAGVAEAHLWLLVGNDRARQFYERDGWSPDGTRREQQVWGITVDEVRYRRLLQP